MSKVYLLEDDKSICELVSCALESSGIRVNTFNTVRDFSAAMQEGIRFRHASFARL